MHTVLFQITTEIVDHLQVCRFLLHDCIKSPDDCWPEPSEPTGPQSDVRIAQEEPNVWIRIAKWEEPTILKKQMIQQQFQVGNV